MKLLKGLLFFMGVRQIAPNSNFSLFMFCPIPYLPAVLLWQAGREPVKEKNLKIPI
jgi:hypothetical protein